MAQATNTTLGEIKLSGDIMPSDANAPQITPSGVVPGVYPVVQKIHVDSKGRTLWIGSLSANELTEDILPYASDTVAGAVKLGGEFTTDTNGALSAIEASVSTKGVMKVGTGLYVNQSSGAVDVDLPVGSTSAYGGIKVTNLFNVAGDGTLSVNGNEVLDQLTSPATSSSVGVVKVGQYFSNTGSLSVNIPYASSSVYGIVKAGTGSGFIGLQVGENTLSAYRTLAGSPYLGVVQPAADQLYMDPGTGVLNVHACHPSLWGWLYGVSGPNIALDDATSTLSATYTFDSFTTDATTSVLGRVQVGDRIDVDVNGTISLPNATADYGVIKVTGRVFKVDGNGKLYWDSNYIAGTTYAGHVMPDGNSIYFSDLPTATIAADLNNASIIASAGQKGQVQIGSGISVNAGEISIPDATTSSKGLIQAGAGISVTNGVISLSTNNLPTASKTEFGAFYVGSGLNVTDNELSLAKATNYSFGAVSIDPNTFLSIDQYGSLNFKCKPATYSEIGYVWANGNAENGISMTDGAGTPISIQSHKLNLFTVPGQGMFLSNGAINARLASNTEKGIVVPGGRGIDMYNGYMSVAKASKTNFGLAKPDGLTTFVSNGTLSLDSSFDVFKPSYMSRNYFNEAGHIDVVQRFSQLSVLSDNGVTRVLELPAEATNSIIVFEPPSDNITNFDILIKSNSQFLNLGTSDRYIVYKIVYKSGTTTPINIRIQDYNNGTYKVTGGSSYVGTGLSEGMFIVFRLKSILMNNITLVQVSNWYF